MRYLIALATYNERENLPSLLSRIFEVVPAADVLVVDDNSPDGTALWVENAAQEEKRLALIKREGKLGLGTAVIEAMNYAIKNDYDFFVNMDADWSHSPDAVAQLIDAVAGYDVAMGSRYVPGGKIEGWSLLRKIMSRCINGFARFRLGLSTRDNSGSFRCYRVATLEKLDFSSIRSRGYSFFEEILFRLKKANASFVEVPITFTDRRLGCSKINIKEIIKALWILATLK